jgi:hypothetical protein
LPNKLTFEEQKEMMQNQIKEINDEIIIAINLQAIMIYKLKLVRQNRLSSSGQIMDAASNFRTSENNVKKIIVKLISTYENYFEFIAVSIGSEGIKSDGII